MPLCPPQTIISLPAHAAVCKWRAAVVTRDIIEEAVAGTVPSNDVTARPDRRGFIAGGRRAVGGHRRPSVDGWIVASAIIEESRTVDPTPDDHLRAGPDGGVRGARSG